MLRLKWWLAEKLANALPKRVIIMVLFRLTKEFGHNKHITLISAAKKYKTYVR